LSASFRLASILHHLSHFPRPPFFAFLSPNPGIAGLSLLGHQPQFKAIDPVFALPLDVCERLGLPATYAKTAAAATAASSSSA
jgi:hypothetical protein